MDEDGVRSRLESARIRLAELLALNSGDLAGVDGHLRQRHAQEVFFHLGGGIEFFGQLAAEQRGIGNPETVTVAALRDQLRGDSLEAPLRALYVNPRSTPFPADPYSDDGYLWRIYNYRHQVTHRGFNPFHIRVFLGDAGLSTASPPAAQDRSVSFLLDPLDPTRGPSRETVRNDGAKMLDLVERWIETAIAAL